MKQFDTDKFKAWVEEQGGWKAVVAKLVEQGFIDTDSIEMTVGEGGEHLNLYDPLTEDPYNLWMFLGLNIHDFLSELYEKVDARTAWNILACGGVLRTLLGGCDPVDHYLKLYEEDGESVKIVWSLNHNFENTSGICPELYVQDYEVISWGEYKHDK